MKPTNLNTQVWLRFTPAGARAANWYLDQVNASVHPKYRRAAYEPSILYKMSLWEAVPLLAPLAYVGAPLAIEDNALHWRDPSAPAEPEAPVTVTDSWLPLGDYRHVLVNCQRGEALALVEGHDWYADTANGWAQGSEGSVDEAKEAAEGALEEAWEVVEPSGDDCDIPSVEDVLGPQVCRPKLATADVSHEVLDTLPDCTATKHQPWCRFAKTPEGKE